MKKILEFSRQRRRILLMMFVIMLSLLLFEEVADDVFHDPSEGDYEAQVFDSSITGFMNSLRTDRLTRVMTDLTSLGSVSVIFTMSIIFVSIMTMFRDFKGIGFLSLILAGAGAWPTLLKMYFARPRPDESTWLVTVGEYSFPSGHSFGAAAVYIGLAYYARKYAKTQMHEIFFYFLGGLLALLVGLSRIYLGVHYPTDVIAGLCGGITWALTVACIYEGADLLFVSPCVKINTC